jgi:catechol 2,3-dioxygenase
MAIRRINHIVLKVRSLIESDKFYGDALGLKRVGERADMWFYSAGEHHHDLALIEVGDEASSPGHRQTGLFHFCFDVDSEASLASLHHRCSEAGIQILGEVDHNIMRSFYVRDPDGNIVELGVDLPREEWFDQSMPFARDRAYSIANVESA